MTGHWVTLSGIVKFIGVIVVGLMSSDSKSEKSRWTPSPQSKSLAPLPSLAPGRRLSSLLLEARGLRAGLRRLQEVPELLETLKQGVAAEVISLRLSFEMANNDMKHRCDNLQATIVNMEEIRLMDRAKHQEALREKDDRISQLTKRLLQSETQQNIKTELLALMSGSPWE